MAVICSSKVDNNQTPAWCQSVGLNINIWERGDPLLVYKYSEYQNKGGTLSELMSQLKAHNTNLPTHSTQTAEMRLCRNFALFPSGQDFLILQKVLITNHNRPQHMPILLICPISPWEFMFPLLVITWNYSK